MKKNLISSFFENLTSRQFIGLLFLYQLCFIFQGIDFADEGFYGAFYQQIFRDPQSVEYNFMYWFSGIVGGAYLHFFPQFGLLALRLGGVLMITATMALVYRLLKPHIGGKELKTGLLLATVLISFDPKDLNYDNMSSLLLVGAASLLFHGLNRHGKFAFFLSGALISLNTFTRLPNILGLAMGAVIIYHGWLLSKKPVLIARQTLYFGAGFALATLLILAVMHSMGHLSVFMDCVSLVREMGKSTENTHGLKRMMKLFRYEYSMALIRGGLALAGLILTGALLGRIPQRPPAARAGLVLACLLLALSLLMAIRGIFFSWYLLLSTISGLSIIAALGLLLTRKTPVELKVLALLGLGMLLIQPLGSDMGMYSMGRYSLWLALPVATHYFFGPGRGPASWTALEMSPQVLSGMRRWTVCFFLLLFGYYALTYTWYDSRDRTKMIYSVNNQYVRGVFTTKAKADALNELLSASARYVHKDDYVLVYDLFPLYYPMTQTKPFVRNSWPKLYDRVVFNQELQKAVEEKKMLPVIIYQTINTTGSLNWPDIHDQNKDWDLNQPRNAGIRQFLDSNHYRLTWENIAFKIYVPPAR